MNLPTLSVGGAEQKLGKGREMDHVTIVSRCFLVLIISVTIFGLGVSTSTYYERAKAIEANVGRYAVDPKTGATTFVYGKEE